MNNLQIDAQDEQDEDISEVLLIHSKREKPDYYLGAFDTEESITQAYKIINKTAYDYYNSNKFLFKSNGYEPEDLVNEIHLKLLHKFKKQSNPFWVDTYSNLKTISMFTLNKLIRIITQESKPLSNPLSMFTTNNDDTENNMEDVLFNTDIDRSVTDYDLYVLNIKNELDRINPYYSKIFSYTLFLNDNYFNGLTPIEVETLKEMEPRKSVIKAIIEKFFPDMEKPIKTFEKEYMDDLKEVLEYVGLEANQYVQDQGDYNLITKGGSLKGLSEEDINRLRFRGAIIDEDTLRVTSLKDEAKRLTEIEKAENGGSVKVVNGALVKKPKALSNKEKRVLQHERFSNSENLYGKTYSLINEEPVLN